MPDQTLAPLLTMSEADNTFFHDDRAFANSTMSRWDVMQVLLAELDAQRVARATAYAEGQRAAFRAGFLAVVNAESETGWSFDGPSAADREVEAWAAWQTALRDTPAPPREASAAPTQGDK